MSKVYVVMGSHGEYSDRSEWCVAAYLDEALAKAHEAALDAALTAWAAKTMEEREELMGYPDNYRFKHPLDSNESGGFGRWGGDNGYWVESVDLLTEVPK